MNNMLHFGITPPTEEDLRVVKENNTEVSAEKFLLNFLQKHYPLFEDSRMEPWVEKVKKAETLTLDSPLFEELQEIQAFSKDELAVFIFNATRI